MPDLKHNFTKGRMNKDLDDRLVPNGAYRDAENIEIVTSEGSNVGAAQNVLGTTWQRLKTTGFSSNEWTTKFGYDTAECVGHVVDNDNNSIYWFIRATSTPSPPSYNGYTNLILQYSDKHKLIRPVLVDRNDILNFKSGKQITGINILPAEGTGAESDQGNVMLFWTDNETEPKKINVKVMMSGCNDAIALAMVTHTKYDGAVIDSTTLATYTGTTNDFTEENITVIKKSPLVAPTMALSTSERGGAGMVGTEVTAIYAFAGGSPIENFANNSTHVLIWSVAPNWRDIAAAITLGGSRGARADKIELEATYLDTTTNEETQFIIIARVILINRRRVKIEIISIPNSYAEIVGTAKLEWRAHLIGNDPIYEFKFPRFAYRWRYRDGEVSCYSPFTEVAFEPSTLFDYNLEKGYNISMVNTLRSVTLDRFTEKPNDVIEVEILCKESNSILVYLVDTLKNNETDIIIDSDIISHVVHEHQLLRHWDNIPRKAIAQEITGNRVVYGNYLQNYTISRDNEPTVGVGYIPSPITTLLAPEKSIKSIRNYQVGIVLKDTYGRETPVFTKSEVGINIPIGDCDKSNKIHASLRSEIPSWVTHYKFFVKDPTNEYYNLVMDRFYDAEDGNVWVSFPSAERNKVQIGDYIILKKQHNSDEPVTSDKAKYKILDIQNEVPEYIALKDTSVSKVKVKTLSGGTDKPVVDGISFSFIGPNATEHPEFSKAFKEGNKIQLSDDNGIFYSRIYEIEEGGITYDTTTSTYSTGTTLALYTVELQNVFANDDEGFRNIVFGSSSTFQLNVLQKERDILEEHHGRFFVKIEQDALFRENVVNNMPDGMMEYRITHTQRIRDEAFKYSDATPDLGDSGSLSRKNAKDWAEQNNSANTFECGVIFCWADTSAFAKGHNNPSIFEGQNCSLTRWIQPLIQIPGTIGTWGPPATGGDVKTDDINGSPRPPAYITTAYQAGLANNYFQFHIAGYPGGLNYKKLPDQHVNTNTFTAALKTGALIRFVVGLRDQDSDRDGTNDTVYKSAIYRVVEFPEDVKAISAYSYKRQVRNGVYKEAYRRGAPYSKQAGTCPTRAALRQNWNALQTWIVYFERLDMTVGFQDMRLLDAAGYASEPDGVGSQSIWGQNDADDDGITSDWRISADDGEKVSTSGTADGTRRNYYGPDFIEILEEKTKEDNETMPSMNPGIWETEPKEDIDLEFYYEATDNIPVTIDTTTDSQYIKVGAIVTELSSIVGSAQITTSPTIESVDGTVITLSTNQTISADTQLKLINADGSAVTVTVSDDVADNATVNIKSTTVGEEIHFSYYNCFSYGNGVESNRIRDDFNQVVIDKGPKVSTTAILPYNEERRSSGLIYSGIFNSTVGLNETNQFITNLKITKDLNPEYGSIQKLHSRNTDLITFCEDKVIRVLANKDALYNADGNVNLTATENVLGQAVPYIGEFGISKNPESFSSYAFRAYFVDKSRGAVLRLSRDGLTDISSKGMTSYFGSNLPASNLILGSYDEDKQCYNVTHTSTSKGKDVTVSFDERVDGWTSFKSFVPENGCSLNNVYYTFKNGDLFSHDNSTRNEFYDIDYESSITMVLNDSPSTIKQFKTLNYEGTTSREYTYAGTVGGTSYTGLTIERLRELSPTSGKQDNGSDFTVTNTKGWYCNTIQTNDQSGFVHEFKEKEGIWFNNIIGDTTALSNLDSQEFSVQGIDNASNISGARTHGDLTVELALTTANALHTAELQSATHIYPSTNTIGFVYGATLSGTRTLYITPKSGYILTASDFTATNPSGVTNTVITQDGDNVRIVATLGGANFVSSGSQTITINIAGLGAVPTYSHEGSYNQEVENVTDLSGSDHTNLTGYNWVQSGDGKTYGAVGEEKLVFQEQYVCKKSGGEYTHYFETNAPYFQFLSHAEVGVNEPDHGGRYRLVQTDYSKSGDVILNLATEKSYKTDFKLYFTFPEENTPVSTTAPKEQWKVVAKAVPVDAEGATIRSWMWGSASGGTVTQTVPVNGDDGRTITVFGGEGTKYKLKQTDPDGVVTYLLGDQFTQAVIDSTGSTTVLAPVTGVASTASTIWKYEITGDLEDPFEKNNPFYAYQYGSFDQTFRASAASGDLVLTAAADVVRPGLAYSNLNVDFTWTITPSGSIPMKFYGTSPTGTAPLFTNLDTNNFDISFTDITSTFNGAKTSLSIASEAEIETHGTTDNISTLNLDSFVKLNEAPISLAQSDVDVANNTVENIILTLTQASAVIQAAEGDTLAYSIVANGSKGTAAVTNAATGACTYTPTNSSSSGADSFTFKTNDGHQDSNTSTIAVDIDAGGGSPSYNVSYWEKDTEVANDPYYAFTPTDVTVAVTNFSASDTGNVILTISDMDFNYNSGQGDIPSYVNALGDLTITVVTTGTSKYGDDTSILPTSGTIVGGGTSSVNIGGLAFEAQIPNSGTVANGDVLNIKVQIAYDNLPPT